MLHKSGIGGVKGKTATHEAALCNYHGDNLRGHIQGDNPFLRAPGIVCLSTHTFEALSLDLMHHMVTCGVTGVTAYVIAVAPNI